MTLILIALTLGAVASYIDEAGIDESIQRALRRTFDRLNRTMETLSQTADAQWTRLEQDTQALLGGMAEQFRQSLDTVLAEGRNVEETVTAELQHAMTNLVALAGGLVAAVEVGMDDTIGNLVQGLERQRVAMSRQIEGVVQGALRPAQIG